MPTAELLKGCIIEESFITEADESVKAFSGAMAHIAEGASPEARKLMLALCRTVAEQDRLSDMNG